MSIIATVLFVLSGVGTLYLVFNLIGGYGQWSLLLIFVLFIVLLSLWQPMLESTAKAICGITSGMTALFIVMSLLGSTIGSGCHRNLNRFLLDWWDFLFQGLWLQREQKDQKPRQITERPEILPVGHFAYNRFSLVLRFSML